ncbi:hypothetical protein ABZ897_20945 [Nonomuraea sp. NPDC046802]
MGSEPGRTYPMKIRSAAGTLSAAVPCGSAWDAMRADFRRLKVAAGW